MSTPEPTAYKIQIELVMEAIGYHPALDRIPSAFTEVSVEDDCIVFSKPLRDILEERI